MTADRYPPDRPDAIDEWQEDDGTMPDSVEALRQAVVGRKIVSAEQERFTTNRWGYERAEKGLVLTLDDGTQARMANTEDCCAHTYLESFLLHPDKVDHVIIGVGTTEGYTRWHIYADLGDVLELAVSWSSGNPFYYGYGFDIDVVTP